MKQTTMDQPSQFRPMNMSNPPCQFVGSLNKGHIQCILWKLRETGQGLELIQEVWRRAQFERIMFVAFDGYTVYI